MTRKTFVAIWIALFIFSAWLVSGLIPRRERPRITQVRGRMLMRAGSLAFVAGEGLWVAWRIRADSGLWWEPLLAVTGITLIAFLSGMAIGVGVRKMGVRR